MEQPLQFEKFCSLEMWLDCLGPVRSIVFVGAGKSSCGGGGAAELLDW
jgi:hypothetical protein